MFHWLQLAVAALALLGVAYYLLCLWSAASFLLARRRSRTVNGAAAATLGSKLEALGISTEFSAGVLTARQVEGGIRFALGSTLAFSREALDSVGGLEPLVDYLADDYQLGLRISAQGYKVLLADVNVESFVPGYS